MAGLLLTLIIIAHLACSVFGTYEIRQSILLTRNQKLLNVLFLWLILFLWYLAIKSIHKKSLGSEHFPIKNDKTSDNFYDNGDGA
jgi:hypothetical protein